jgi:hypothetical protein
MDWILQVPEAVATSAVVLRRCNSGEAVKIWRAVAQKLRGVSNIVLWPKHFFLIFYFLGPQHKFRNFGGEIERGIERV